MSEENKAMVRRFYQEVFANGNIGALDELCAPDFVDRSPMPGQDPGIQGMRDMMFAMHKAFGDMRVNVEEMVAEGDTVAARFSVTCTHKGSFMGEQPTGKTVTMHGIDMVRMKNGKAAEVWHYGDEGMVFAELGMKPPM